MRQHTFLGQRLLNALTFAHWQQAPYSTPTEALRVRTTDGIELGATLFARGYPDVVIICHGFASTQRSLGIVWLAEMLAGWRDVLTFDWRGYRRSGGRSSLGGDEALDLLAMLTHAREQGYRRVGLIGESMGGLIVLATLGAAASTNAEAALPAAYPDRIATLGAPADYMLTCTPRPQMVRYLTPHPRLRPLSHLMGFRMGSPHVPQPLDVVGHIPRPLLFVHGDRDGIVPVHNAYLLHQHAPHATLRIYPETGHGVEAMRVRLPQMLLKDLRNHFDAQDNGR
jgi:pimeloyl-ACP methyl ester carboxylesterase